MNDRAMSMTCAVAWALWVVAALLLVASIVAWDHHTLSRQLGRMALFAQCVAMTATIRGYFVRHARIMRSVLAVRDSEPHDLRSVR